MELEKYEKYKNKYYNIINQCTNNQIDIPQHKQFEYLCALDSNMIMWEDIPPGFDDKFDVPTRMDYGIDLISLDYDKTGQVKYYSKNSSINYSDIANYQSYSNVILKISNMTLYTTFDAKICKMADRLMKGCIKVERKSFQELIDKIPQIEIKDEIKKEVLIIEQRDYLIECTNIFFENDKNIFRFQLPCGSGKSFIIFNIILEDIKNSENENEKYIIFVPWKELATQMKKDANNVGLHADIIGDGNHTINDNINVIICINPSVDNIINLNFKYKFIDEAHHLEDDDSILRNKINKIKSEKTLELSATFKNNVELDYEMNLRDAIENNYLTDYKLVIQYYTKGNKWDAMMKTVIDNYYRWQPLFIYFNSTERAIQFSKECNEKGLHTNYLIGKDNASKREKIRKQIENYELSILCLCGVYNEGVSIDNVVSVMFADLRHSEINRIQVSMRASRKHKNKPFFNIILPVISSDFEQEDISDLLNTFFKIDPLLKDSFKNKSVSRIPIQIDNQNRENDENVENENIEIENAELIYEEVYNRFGELIKGNRIEEKINEFLEYLDIKDNKIPFSHDKSIKFSDGTLIGKFWCKCKTYNKCFKS